MTVGIGIVTGEGIVVAADSRTRATPATGVARVLSDYTHKVFQVAENALCTYGFAFINGRNVAAHVAEFAAIHQGTSLGPHPCTELLVEFLGPRLDGDLAQLPTPLGADQIALGFLVGGYSDDGAALWEAQLPQRTIQQIPSPGCAWRGQTDVIRRIVKGCDFDLLHYLAEQAGLGAHVTALQPVIAQLEYRMAFDGWNLQDAVDYAVYAVRTTIDTQRLTMGVAADPDHCSWPGVGGPIEIAAVTAAEGFSWVQRTRLAGERAPGVAEDL